MPRCAVWILTLAARYCGKGPAEASGGNPPIPKQGRFCWHSHERCSRQWASRTRRSTKSSTSTPRALTRSRPSLITVRSTPTQSYYYQPIGAWWFDCQPDRHCAKTIVVPCKSGSTFDCQLDRHCSKTVHRLSDVRYPFVLPARSTLLQNNACVAKHYFQFDYQLDRHCSKTVERRVARDDPFDYQLDRHCSKTYSEETSREIGFDYQLDRHCSKTKSSSRLRSQPFDYQLDRHCSKTPSLFVYL